MKLKVRNLLGFGAIGLLAIGVLVYAFLHSAIYNVEPTKPVTVAELQKQLQTKQQDTETANQKPAKIDDQPVKQSAQQTTPGSLPHSTGKTSAINSAALPSTGPSSAIPLFLLVFTGTFLASEVVQLIKNRGNSI